ncbi:hypothetical protein K402DRAFT_98388 [Aulographum hederae CBS 113979]|uniref:Uncharacterized protein n=1 Tax=Aulographum hederae CBS 113979 TaxID=1176131 RepID=A0A6G1GYM6_9PEZI|nr:hypothetical protein K402DRAFT_98388 [Aulographum hederae CBS 113979]
MEKGAKTMPPSSTVQNLEEMQITGVPSQPTQTEPSGGSKKRTWEDTNGDNQDTSTTQAAKHQKLTDEENDDDSILPSGAVQVVPAPFSQSMSQDCAPNNTNLSVVSPSAPAHAEAGEQVIPHGPLLQPLSQTPSQPSLHTSQQPSTHTFHNCFLNPHFHLFNPHLRHSRPPSTFITPRCRQHLLFLCQISLCSSEILFFQPLHSPLLRPMSSCRRLSRHPQAANPPSLSPNVQVMW